MANALAGAALIINNETIPYVPNSLKYDVGNPERKVEPQVVGGGAVTNVVTEDFATAKSKIMFDLKTTTENEQLFLGWVENFEDNLVKIVSNDGKSRVFELATIINKPEFDTGADGIASIEFESNRSVVA